jgi:hypothetical protein
MLLNANYREMAKHLFSWLEELDDTFNSESIWAFKVKPEPSRFTADIEQAKGDISASKLVVTHYGEPKV